MHNVFDKDWEKVIALKPPWTLIDILTCLLKHWISVISFTLTSESKFLIETLKDFFSKFGQEGKRFLKYNLALRILNQTLYLQH